MIFFSVKCENLKYLSNTFFYHHCTASCEELSILSVPLMLGLSDVACGRVTATMEVKEDFYMYRSGVYRYSLPADHVASNHRRTGFHSVKILGYVLAPSRA